MRGSLVATFQIFDMKWFFEDLYYRIYQINSKNEKDIPYVLSAIFYASLIFLIVFPLLIIIHCFLGDSVFIISKTLTIILVCSLMIFNVIYFVGNKRYIKIIERYKEESAVDIRRGKLQLIYFLIGSLCFFYIVVTVCHHNTK